MAPVSGKLKAAIQSGRYDTIQLDVVTGVLAGNTTHEFTASEDDSEVNTVNVTPSDASLPIEAQLMMIRPVVVVGSTDSDFFIHEDGDRQDVDEVIRITSLDVNTGPQTFQPGGGMGVPFLNQDGNNGLWFRIEENSGNNSSYAIRIRFIDVLSPQ